MHDYILTIERRSFKIGDTVQQIETLENSNGGYIDPNPDFYGVIEDIRLYSMNEVMIDVRFQDGKLESYRVKQLVKIN